MSNEWILPNGWEFMVAALCDVLHQRSAWRLAVIVAGIIFAKGRQTVTSWFRSAGINRRYKAFYYFTRRGGAPRRSPIGSIGRKTETVAQVLFECMLRLIYKNEHRNKLCQAVQLAQWAQYLAIRLGKQLWIVTDGGFTKARFLIPVIATGVTLVSRLRREVIAGTFFATSGHDRKIRKILRQFYKLMKSGLRQGLRPDELAA